MPSPRIRKARPADAHSICALVKDTIRRVNAPDYSRAQLRAWLARNTPARILRNILRQDRALYVIDDAGRIVGVAGLKLDRSEVGSLYVLKERSGTGLGSKLMDHIERCARNQGMSRLRLSSTITAKGFYLKRGYRVIRRSNHLMGKINVPCYLMTRRL